MLRNFFSEVDQQSFNNVWGIDDFFLEEAVIKETITKPDHI